MSMLPNTPTLDLAGMEARMDAIRLKQILGGPLTERELMCLQFEEHGFGCSSCSPSASGQGDASPAET